MPPKGQPKSNTNQKTDERFATLLKQPRFKTKSVQANKGAVKQDERFKDVFDDDDFEVKKIDKFQRVEKQSAKDSLSKLYELPPQDEKKSNSTKPSSNTRRIPTQSQTMDSDDEIESTTMKDNTSDDEIDHEQNEDEDDDEQQESSTDIGTTDDDELDDLTDDEEIVPDGYTQGSLPGSLAPLIDEPTSRLALYNMEWDQLRAVDILAIFRSLCPVGGSISRVSVFPSEKGKIMLEREKRGDFTLWTDPAMDKLANDIRQRKKEAKANKQFKEQFRNGTNNKNAKKVKKPNLDEIELSDSDEYISDTEIDKILFGNDIEDKKIIERNRTQLKEYELAKLGYYYAIIECNSVDTAVKLYHDVDGLEYESSGNIFDLRFVPAQHQFDETTLRDRATSVPPGHRPPVFQTNCLHSTNLECTWEREDPHRERLLHQDFTKGEYHVDDLTAFLANESDEEGFETDVPISETDSGDSDITDEDEDDDDNNNDEDDEHEYLGSGPLKAIKNVKKDTLGKDLIAGNKVVDGKKKKIVLLKRRARNEFADILEALNSDSKETKNKKNKAAILATANKANQLDDDDDEDHFDVEDDEQDDFDEPKDDFGGSDDEDHESEHDDDIKQQDKMTKLQQKGTKGKKKESIGFGQMIENSDSDSDIITTKRQIEKNRAILLQAAKTKQALEQERGKTKIILKSTRDNDGASFEQDKINRTATRNLNKAHNRELRMDLWKKGASTLFNNKKDIEEEPQMTEKQKQYLERQKLRQEKEQLREEKQREREEKLKQKQKPIEGSIYDDDVLDDDDFFKHTEEYFPASEFGEVTFGTTTSNNKNDTETTKSTKIKRKQPLQATMDDSDTSQDEGYNLQELVQRNKIKQMAIANKKKSSKELEDDLIAQSLGADSYTTTQNSTLSAKELKQATYLVNKQSVNKEKSKKIRVNLDQMASESRSNNKDLVSLANGGTINDPSSTSFKVNVQDSRFASVFDDADFGIDTTNPLFQNTEGTSEILAESQRRRQDKSKKQLEMTKQRKAGTITTTTSKDNTTTGLSDELAQLIGQTKANAKRK